MPTEEEKRLSQKTAQKKASDATSEDVLQFLVGLDDDFLEGYQGGLGVPLSAVEEERRRRRITNLQTNKPGLGATILTGPGRGGIGGGVGGGRTLLSGILAADDGNIRRPELRAG